MISRIYEDMVVGRITEDNANILLTKSQAEQQTLKNRVVLNNQRLEKQEQQKTDNAHWIELIKEYSDIKELDAVIINRLIKKIAVHEDIDGNVVRQTVEIYFNFTEQSDKYKLIRQ